MLHGLIYVNEGNIQNYMNSIEGIICDGITNNDDPACGRIAAGLVSDLSNYFEKGMSRYASGIMQRLNFVLTSPECDSETKIHAMIAVGDVCLAIEEDFL